MVVWGEKVHRLMYPQSIVWFSICVIDIIISIASIYSYIKDAFDLEIHGVRERRACSAYQNMQGCGQGL